MKLSKILLILIFLIFMEGCFHIFQTSFHDSYLKNDKVEINENLNLSDSQQEYYIMNWTKDIDYSYRGVATDSEGNVYFVGYASDIDYSLLKYAANGTLLWSRKRNIRIIDLGIAVVVDSEDNVYITGWCSTVSGGGGEVQTIKYNKSGDLEWQRVFGSDNQVYDMTIDDEDNIYISGHTEDFGVPPLDKDMLILKYNSSGTCLWYRRSELTGSDFGYGIDYNSFNGLIYVTGSHAGNLILFTYDKNGNLINTINWDNGASEIGKDISINQITGDIYVTGTIEFSYVVFDSFGNNIQNVTGSSQRAITVDNLGRIFVSKVASNKIYLSKFYNDGRNLWNLTVDYMDYPERITQSVDGSVYIVSHNGRLLKFKVDDVNPKVNISSPTSLESFGKVRPDIALDIEEPNLNKTWYFLSNSSITTPNLEWEGKISQNIWEIFSDGIILINISANDSNGNFGFDSVTVIKNTSINFYWNLTNNRIFIDDTDPNQNWEMTETLYPWCYGSGKFKDPYIIENLFIDGNNSGSCLYIKNSNVSFIIRNSNFSNSGSGYEDAGIRLEFTSHGKILNNNCSNNGQHGIYLHFSSNNNTISNNSIMNNNGISGGIYIRQCNSNNISENNVKLNNRHGVNLEHCYNNIISKNNISSNNGDGISLDPADDNKILYNQIFNNRRCGVNSDGGSNNTISYNVIYKNSNGIILNYHGRFNNVSFNFLNENVWGILLDKEEDNILYFNNISNCTQDGIILAYSDRNNIVGNLVEFNGENGISLITNSDHNNITNNEALHNGQYGIYNEDQYNSIIGNIASYNNESGIFTAGNTEFHDNNASYNLKNGLLLSQNTEYLTISNNFLCFNLQNGVSTGVLCSYNRYFNNTINWNSLYGIELGTSDFNDITYNYLIGNSWGCINLDHSTGNIIDANYCDDRFENNDNFASAHLIIADYYENLRIIDPDWYFIYIEANMTLSITFFISTSYETIDILLYSSENELIHSNMALTNGFVYKYTAVSSDYYYICLLNANELSYSMDIEINLKSDENNNHDNPENQSIPGYDIALLLLGISCIILKIKKRVNQK